MRRLHHGVNLSLEEFEAAREEVHQINERLDLPFSFARPTGLTRFDYLFPTLQEDEASLLPESPSTVAFLTSLGAAMKDVDDKGDLDPDHPLRASAIPSVYTYFGQFVDHDVTLEVRSETLMTLTNPALAPLPLDTVREKLKNCRSAALDLDSLYNHPAPRDGALMKLGLVSKSTQAGQSRPPGKDDLNDLPRNERSREPRADRAAKIGDFRNDIHLIVAQLHVAFLRAHNELVRQGNTFDQAQRLLRQHYQWIVIHDFLERIADPDIVERIRGEGNRFYDPFAEPFFLPLEFTVAAYRFGHSMVRRRYDFNRNFSPTTLGKLFTFTALSGGFDSTFGVERDTLPENWIIEWERFVEGGTNRARPIDTRIVEPLSDLRNEIGGPLRGDSRLAVRNLLRGYQLRMPTGQAVAAKLGIPKLTKVEVFDAVSDADQMEVLEAAGFLDRTPLWYYILAEARALGNGGDRLGPVGSTLVAEVLIGLVRRSQDSILTSPGWTPSLGTGGDFKLPDLLRLAGVLS
jgi:hypothetical protein